jgi:hypothetical protein
MRRQTGRVYTPMIDRTYLLYHTILEVYYIRVMLRATLVIYT